MKKIVLILLGIFVSIYIIISLMVRNDKRYTLELYNEVYEKSKLEDIEYVNYYDNHYIVIDNDYLYLFNDEFNLIVNIDKSLLYDKYDNYDIIYRDMTLMLMDNYKNEEGIVFKYYDIYTGECIDYVIIS